MIAKSTKSRTLLDLLKNADLFGDQINFTLDNKSQVRTFPGLLMTLILAATFCVMFIFLGKSFFFHSDPITSFSEYEATNAILFDPSQMESLFVALRVKIWQDVIKLDKTVVLEQFQIAKETSSGNSAILLRECSKFYSFRPELLPIDDLDGLYCFDFSSISYMGGERSWPNANYFQLQIKLCNPSSTNAKESANCDLYQLTRIKAGYYVTIEMYYPNVFFDSTSENGIFLRHSLIKDQISLTNEYTRTFNFLAYTFKDDVGKIFEDYQYSINYVVGDTNIQYLYNPNPSTHATYKFVVGNKFRVQSRKYQKIQDVLAVTGGFIKIVQIVLKLVIVYWIKVEKNTTLMNRMINWRWDDDDYEGKAVNEKVASFFQKISQNQPQNYSRLENNSQNISKNIINNNNQMESFLNMTKDQKDKVAQMKQKGKSTSEFSNNNSNINEKRSNAPNILNNNNINPHGKSVESGEKSPGKERKVKKKGNAADGFILTTCEKLKNLLVPRGWLNGKDNIRIRMYKHAELFIKKQLDIFGYFDILFELQKLRELLFNPSQILAISYIDKPSILLHRQQINEKHLEMLKERLNLNEEVHVKSKEIEQMSKYFQDLIEGDGLSEVDKKIISRINTDIAEKVLDPENQNGNIE